MLLHDPDIHRLNTIREHTQRHDLSNRQNN